MLPLRGFERPAREVWLGGFTRASDDVYKEAGEELYIGFFGTGAYQEMLSGVVGAHHCLLPEAKVSIVERKGGVERQRVVLGQTSDGVLAVLGYEGARPAVPG